MALKEGDRAAIRAGSASVIVGILGKFAGRSRSFWLDLAHSYPDGTVPKKQSLINVMPPADVVQTIAIRGPLHCIDGWGYLGRSLSALAAGNAHAARHLAYYAELRAALSILASQGIGIFNGRNAVVDQSGSVMWIKDEPTHQMCWEVIEFWASLDSSFEVMTGLLNSTELLFWIALKHISKSIWPIVGQPTHS